MSKDNLEIERKFLTNRKLLSLLNNIEGVEIRQGYLSAEPGGVIRIRTNGFAGYITLKVKKTGFIRHEFEYQIPREDAERILDLFSAKQIIKTRYAVMHEGRTWEIDVFGGENEGLIVAEIELESENDSFSLPDWVLQEVTDDSRYMNSNLVNNPYKNWKGNNNEERGSGV